MLQTSLISRDGEVLEDLHTFYVSLREVRAIMARKDADHRGCRMNVWKSNQDATRDAPFKVVHAPRLQRKKAQGVIVVLALFAFTGCASVWDKLNAARDHKPPTVIKDVWELGMTKSEVRLAWSAKCRQINRTVGVWGTHEQWVYGVGCDKAYLYFENGRLIAWQD